MRQRNMKLINEIAEVMVAIKFATGAREAHNMNRSAEWNTYATRDDCRSLFVDPGFSSKEWEVIESAARVLEAQRAGRF